MGEETKTLERTKSVSRAKQRAFVPLVRWQNPEELRIERNAPGMRLHRKKPPTGNNTQNQEVRSQVKLERQLDNKSSRKVTLLPSDAHYQQELGTASWDLAPIVVPEYKLLFFTIPKVGCTVFKQLFRRIAQCPDWRTHSIRLPHDPSLNNLTYLSDYDVDDALHIMTSDEWTRAVFVRHPMNRIISAYLNKAVDHSYNGGNLSYVAKQCCPHRNICGQMILSSFQTFLHVAHECSDPHWTSQSRRMHSKYWRYINFIGHLETAEADAKVLLERVGAWEEYGATGWGVNGTEPIFASKSTILHTTNPQDRMHDFCSNEAVALVRALYADDYRHPLFGFPDNGICTEPR
ncbi:sulfotransferase family [Fragilaria crotonensis]|nr:sulfotransferase family [Fragilaria crotonensis]